MTAKVLIPQMGPRGLPGAQLIELVNAPTAEDGNDGDFVLRDGPGDDTTLYGPKANGAWPAGRSIRGNVGGQGPIGLQGPTGDPGPPGPAGQQGVSGFKGWSPIFAAVDNGANGTVWQLADWINGQGVKPGNIGYYIGAAGLVAAVGDAHVLPTATAGSTSFNNGTAGFLGNPTNVQAALDAAAAQGRVIGEVIDYAGLHAPSGWLFCYGQAINRVTYAGLYVVIGATYGSGDGSTTFNVPDLRGRVTAGQDDMGGVSAQRITAAFNGNTLGGNGGAQTHTLTEGQMPSHDHGLNYQNGGASGAGSPPAIVRAATVTGNLFGIMGNAGSNQPHNNVQPTIILNKMIYSGVL